MGHEPCHKIWRTYAERNRPVNEYGDLLTRLGVESYKYDNATGGSKAIQKKWEEVLGRSTPPGIASSFSLIGCLLWRPRDEDVIASIPSLETRANDLAHYKIVSEACEKVVRQHDISVKGNFPPVGMAALEAIDWINETEEGQKAFQVTVNWVRERLIKDPSWDNLLDAIVQKESSGPIS